MQNQNEAHNRCGICHECKTVEATKRLVLVEARPTGPGINDQSVRMWNQILKDNPCKEKSNVTDVNAQS